MNRMNIALSATVGDGGVISVRDSYLNAIWHSGGIPTLLSPSTESEYIQEVAGCFDGFVFCGGEDIDPKYYGEGATLQIKNICSVRDEFEERLFRAAYASGKPILGICRGMQVVNVFLGGSLTQHIGGHIQSESREVRTHSVRVVGGSLLAEILDCGDGARWGKSTRGAEIARCGEMMRGGEILVNSFHHQVVNRLAAGLTIDAISGDGYIEACHSDGHKFLLCLQWHPECYYSLDSSSRLIFDAFIQACGGK